MSEQIVNIKSISQLHEFIGFEKPKHPLISIIDVSKMKVSSAMIGQKMTTDLYSIALKDKSCGMEYGRCTYDFEEGVLVFMGPNQMITPTQSMEVGENSGWMLLFHPDLIRKSHLVEEMENYSFFDYDVNEALHLSDDEQNILLDCISKIKDEYEARIDNHSQRVIISNLELLLNYCLRFYERQFNTRTNQNQDITSKFLKELKLYFKTELQTVNGIPSIQYFSDKIHLSSNYLSDLLRKETGRGAKDHINDFVVEKAKNMLLGTNDSVSEIAYSLGFNYPHYFTRLFKSKTGNTPVKYRSLN